MIAAGNDSARRHAGGRERRLNFPERIRGRPRVRRADRHVDDDRAGALAQPGLRQPHHIGALRSGETAARLADEDDDRAVGFLDGDRMALAVVVGKRRRDDLRVGVLAGPQHDGKADERSRQAEGAAAIERACSVVIGLVLVPPQSVIKP